MSNLASRSFEWDSWEIEERLFELPHSARSKGSRKEHYRILLTVYWKLSGQELYVLSGRSSPTKTLLCRGGALKGGLPVARILALRLKNSKGLYREQDPSLIDRHLTFIQDSQ